MPNNTPSPQKNPNNENSTSSSKDNKSPNKKKHSTKSVSSSPESSLTPERIIQSRKRNKASRNFLPAYASIYVPYRSYNYPPFRDWNRLMSGAPYSRMPNCRYCVPYLQGRVFSQAPRLPPFWSPYPPFLPPPMLRYSMPPPPLPKEIPMPSSYKAKHYSPEQIIAKKEAKYNVEQSKTAAVLNDDVTYDVTPIVQDLPKDADYFLTLPKSIFPATSTIQMDPNPLIDELCKLDSFDKNLSWMLDLEFGVPRGPITRPIPIYDVKYNSIHCKNAPSAIHPGFESCSEEFKRILLFYYDCVVSSWYKGYVIMNSDHSVENFQSWLLLAMQMYGMCWR